MFKRETKTSSTFSDFIRGASSKEKKKIYLEALNSATKAQARIIEAAKTQTSTWK